MSRLKGLTGEELPATLFAVVLLFVFIFFIFTSYSDFFSRAAFIEQERIANTLAEQIVQSNRHVVSNPDTALGMIKGNVKGAVLNLQTGQNWTKGSVNGTSVAASSRPLLLLSGGAYYPGRVEVYVGK